MLKSAYIEQAICHGVPVQAVESCKSESELLSLMIEFVGIKCLIGREGGNPPTFELPVEWQD